MIFVWKDKVIEELQWLSDIELQYRTLPRENGEFFWTPIENYWELIEDSGLVAALANNQVVFGNKADGILKELHQLMDVVDYEKPDMVIIESPEMQIVREKAALALSYIERGM